LRKQLEEEKESHALTKNALLQEQMVSQGLREELKKVTKTEDKP